MGEEEKGFECDIKIFGAFETKRGQDVSRIAEKLLKSYKEVVSREEDEKKKRKGIDKTKVKSQTTEEKTETTEKMEITDDRMEVDTTETKNGEAVTEPGTGK